LGGDVTEGAALLVRGGLFVFSGRSAVAYFEGRLKARRVVTCSMAVNDHDVQRTARIYSEIHGEQAVARARERVADLHKRGNPT
jgi:hypothetical protein